MDSLLIVVLAINIALSLVVAYVASAKGRSFAGFFWLSFFLSFIVGILAAIAIPAIDPSQRDDVIVDCPHCRGKISAQATACKHCSRAVNAQPELVEQKRLNLENDRARSKQIMGWILMVPSLIFGVSSFVNGDPFMGIILAIVFALGLTLVLKNSKRARQTAS